MEFHVSKNGKLSKIALLQCQDLSYSALMKLLRNKDVKVNGVRVNQDVELKVGDRVMLYYKPKQIEKFNIIYKDQNVLVVYKKSGFSSESVFESLQAEYEQVYFIHRLDRNTSGVMIFALNVIAEKELLFGFKNRTFQKLYRATVYGIPKNKSAVLTAYLLKDSKNSTVKIYDKQVKGSVKIITEYKVIKQFDNHSLLQVILHTGKTHQIRAHLAHIGHFIIGDGKYGDNKINKQFGADKQMLEAFNLTLKFPQQSPLNYLDNKSFSID